MAASSMMPAHRLGRESSLQDELAHKAVLAQLVRAGVPEGDIACHVPLSNLSRWRIGGPADIVVTPSSLPALQAAVIALSDGPLPHIVIGDGTNILFDDQGLRGVVLRIGRAFSSMHRSAPDQIDVGAGCWVPALVRAAVNEGLGGIQHAVGIPGTFGGLCVMNGGSQRRGIGEHIVHVDAVNASGQVVRLMHRDLAFAYRSSLLQDNGLIMTGGRLRLQPAPAADLRREAIGILVSRRAKFPRIRANCGSVFVSDPALYDRIGPPGLAIEQVGLKGHRAGGAQISDIHANFIVNLGSASSRDVLHLIALARQQVLDRTGIAMMAEVRYITPHAVMMPAHEAAEQMRTASGEERHL